MSADTIDPNRLAKRIRRLSLPLLAIALVALYLAVGFVRVPEAMDTLPKTHPPGSLCLIRKGSGAVIAGSAVFARVANGVVLSRVERVLDGGGVAEGGAAERGASAGGAEGGIRYVLRHDNPGSSLPDSRTVGPVAPGAVIGTVLVVFPPQETPLPPATPIAPEQGPSPGAGPGKEPR